MALKEGPDWLVSVGSEAEVLWDVDSADRLVKLALRYPELLTHDEQILWKLIRESGYLWKGRFESPSGRWEWSLIEPSFLFVRLREHWEKFLAVALGEQPASILPKWHETQQEQIASGFDDMDWNVYE